MPYTIQFREAFSPIAVLKLLYNKTNVHHIVESYCCVNEFLSHISLYNSRVYLLFNCLDISSSVLSFVSGTKKTVNTSANRHITE